MWKVFPKTAGGRRAVAPAKGTWQLRHRTRIIAAVEIFGRYQVLDHLATGGMAEIVRARPLSGTRRLVVLKRILPQFSGDLKFVSMFIDEARISIGLSHPHVVKLHDFGQVDGVYFMAMEYVDGTDLSALLQAHLVRGEPLPPIVTAAILRDVADGLAHAHTLADERGRPLGIVHRDVSPQNILLSIAGAVKVTDFGIAAARNKLSRTSPGMVLGKAAYMAPEQAQGLPTDHRTDLWALGVVLWECLTGERLFWAESPVDTLERVLTVDVAPPSTHRPGVPLALDSLALALLSRDRAERPQRTEDVVRALDTVVANLARTSIHATNGSFTAADLSRFLHQVEWADETAPMRPAAPRPPVADAVEVTRKRVTALFDDDVLRDLMRRLREDSEPWILADIGDRALALGLDDVALSAWRTAAAGFASRGLLVQMMVAHHNVRQLVDDDVAREDLLLLGDLPAGDDDALAHLLERFDRHGFGLAILGVDAPLPHPVPLLGALGPRELVRLAEVVRVKKVQAGDVVIREGEAGDVLYAVGRGRLAVSCHPGETHVMGEEADWGVDHTVNEDDLVLPSVPGAPRVYLAGLADGDFFGEFSFLSERPRSATVEAATDSWLLEIERDDVEHIAAVDPAFTAPLLGFYKERVVELMMAKSPVFSLLPPEGRRSLLRDAEVRDAVDGDVLIEEGTEQDSFFFIRRGEVEVYRADPTGLSIFINKLGQGEFFGEMAVLRRSPRSVSVRAIGDVNLFQIRGDALLAVVEADRRVKALFQAMVVRRAAETRARVLEHDRVFFES